MLSPQLAWPAGLSWSQKRGGHSGALSWVSWVLPPGPHGHTGPRTYSPVIPCVTSALPDCETPCVALTFVTTCTLEGLLRRFSTKNPIFSGGSMALRKCGWGWWILCVLGVGWKAVNVASWVVVHWDEMNCLSSDHQLFDMGPPISQDICSSLLTMCVSKWSSLQAVSVMERLPFLQLMCDQFLCITKTEFCHVELPVVEN